MTDIVERLRLLVPSDSSGAAFDAVNELTALRAENGRLRAAATALIDFHNGPREAKRPDVFRLLMVRLNAALEKETSE